MIELPREVIPGSGHKSPRRLIILSHTKIGKTTLLSALPNNLILDFENGSGFVDALKINVFAIAAQKNIHPLMLLKEIASSIKKANAEEGKPIYDYISIDTTSGMETLAVELATMLYKNSNLNAKGEYQGNNVVTDLPKGQGYMWARLAFEEILDLFSPLPGKGFIITTHVKLTSITKDGKEVGARDMDLTGKLKAMLCQSADAIGFLYRKEANSNWISFITDPTDLVTGARPAHLRNKEFEISSYDPDTEEVTVFWDKIFID